MSGSNCPPSRFHFSLTNKDDCFVQSIIHVFDADLLRTYISRLQSSTGEPHMAQMLDAARKRPSNDTNAFEGRKTRASEFTC
jgi:hypothetical protein